MAEEITYTINAETEKATKNIDKFNKKVKESSDVQKDAKKSAKGTYDILGDLGGPIGEAISSVQSLNATFLKLVANPIVATIGAIVLAATALYKAFTSTKEGGEKMQRFWAGFDAVLTMTMDLISDVAEALIKVFTEPQKAIGKFTNMIKTYVVNTFNEVLESLTLIGKSAQLLFTGQFKMAFEVGSQAISKMVKVANPLIGITKAIGEATAEYIDKAKAMASKAASIEEKMQKLSDAEQQLAKDKLKTADAIAKAKEASEDETKSLEYRKKKAKEANDLEIGLAQREASIAKQRLSLTKEKNALSKDSVAGTEAENKALEAYQTAYNSLSEKVRNKQKADKEFSIQIFEKQLTALQNAYIKVNQEISKQSVKLQQIRDDESISINDRIKANEDLKNNIEEGKKAEIANIDEQINKQKEEIKQFGKKEEWIQKLSNLEAQKNAISLSYDNQNSEALKKTNELSAKKTALDESIKNNILDIKEMQDQANIAELDGTYKVWDIKQKLLDEEHRRTIENLQEQIDSTNLGTQAHQDALNAMDKANAAYTINANKLAQDREDNEEKAYAAKLNLGTQTFGALQSLAEAFYSGDEARAKEAFEVNKKLSIAQALMSTFEAVNAALASKIELFPGQRFVMATLAGITGLANVIKISKTQFNSSPSGAGSQGGQTFGPSIGIMGANVNPSTQLAGVINQQVKPVRAFVVGQDVNSQQSLDRHIRQNATV